MFYFSKKEDIIEDKSPEGWDTKVDLEGVSWKYVDYEREEDKKVIKDWVRGVNVDIPITLTDINLNKHEEICIVKTCFTEKEGLFPMWIIKDQLKYRIKSSNHGIEALELKSNTYYNNDNILKIDIEGFERSIKV
tara:strand:- start:229 stop:633 length:405 start_codon:yes stop_codon:yes gene_type:complete